jgi:lipopolysaccharide biosynthesis glycosyltransferase
MFSFHKIFLRLGLFITLVCILPAEEIHVAFLPLDNVFAAYTGVAAYSICKSMDSRDSIIFHIVMTEILHPEHREKFQQLEKLFPVKFKIYDDALTAQHIAEAFPMTDGWHKIGCDAWHLQGMASRLVLDKILSPSIHKVIYLDTDILVFSSLRELWNKLPQEPYAIAGVCDGCMGPHIYPSRVQRERIKDLQIYCPGVSFPFYVHSAVLVFDLDVIRQERLFPKVIEWMMCYHPVFPDQDALNAVLNGRILECEGKWATIIRPIIQNPIKDAAISHLGGQPKPWAKPHKVINGRWWQPKRWPILWKYITLQPPTLWHQYRQDSPWKHSKWAMLGELFSTWNDAKVFLSTFSVIIIFMLLLAKTCYASAQKVKNRTKHSS